MGEIVLAAQSFIKELLWISKDIVWKDEWSAYQKEDISYRYDADLYVLARRGETNFVSFRSFDRDILLLAGIPADEVDMCVADKTRIPNNELMRDNIVRLQTERVLATYVEQNDYYRMLNGLPDIADKEEDFFYHPDYPDTPIHLLTINQLYELEGMGYLDKLYEANRSKKYLRHLGKRKIDPYISRTADKFSLLYMNDSDFSRINNDFRDTYEACRYSVVRSIYVREKRNENEYYDNFMAMSILFMSIQQMLAKYLDADINRDFYDYESLKYVYDSYGVPFYPTIPLEYHIKIIKNINILIRHKGSTAVFFKLFDLFNFGHMDIYDFYIMKVHRLDSAGLPIFKYNPDGSEDLKSMYDIKFGQVRLYDNPPLELSDPQNILTYQEMTDLDPYWIHDDDLIDKLYKTKFNYLESKYIGIRTVFDLMAITYESAIFFKLITDSRNSLKRVNIYFSALNEYIDIFSIIMYISALMCKRYGYEGRLDGDMVYVSKVLGYNFKANLDAVRSDVLANPSVSGDTELLELLTSVYVSSIHTVNQVYGKIEALRDLLVKRRISATTKEAYQAYNELEKALLCSYYAQESFRKADGTQATSFADILSETNMLLYLRYQDIPCDDDTSIIDTEIESLLVILSQNFSNLKYIELCGASSSNLLLEHLFKLLSFFKSAKAELTGYNITYTISKRGESMVKYYDDQTESLKILIDNSCTCDPECDNCEACESDEEKDRVIWKNVDGEFVRVIDDIANDNQQCRCSGCGNHVWMRTDMMMYFEMMYDTDSFTLKLRDDLPVKYGYPIRDGWWLTSDIESVAYNQVSIQKIFMLMHDIIDKFKPTYFIKDALEFADSATMMFEKIQYEGNSWLINDWFNTLTDSLIKVCDVNHLIHKSVFSMSTRLVDDGAHSYISSCFNRLDSGIEYISDKNSKINKSSFSMTDKLWLTYEHVIDEDYLEDYL